jgi:hypothetical protein
MRTAAKPKNTKSSPRKKFVVESTETAMAGITETAGAGSGSFLEQKQAAIPSITAISSEEKRQLIAEAAYYRAEKRSFVPGYELEDWLVAETEIDKNLSTIELPIGGRSDVDTKPRRNR